MKTNYIKMGIIAALAAFSSNQSVKASEVITLTQPVLLSSQTTTTTTTEDARVSSSLGRGMLVSNCQGQQIIVPATERMNQTLYVTTGATIIGFAVCNPDDLITRRDDLLARIFVERSSGKLTAEQSNSLVTEVSNAYMARAELSKGDENCVSHVKGVKRIYKSFDKISNDILKESHQGNKQLAGQYNFIVL